MDIAQRKSVLNDRPTVPDDDPWNPIPKGGCAAAQPSRTPLSRHAPPAVEEPTRAYMGAEGRGRRRHDRVAGPFEGSRAGLLETQISLHDLSVGGCFVNALHEQSEGTMIVLNIDLPHEGWVTVKAETLYRRPGFGFAVRFVDVDAETNARLARSIQSVKDARQPVDPHS